ncbi:MAG: hypothetical protein WBA67_11940 [Jannaschia sp.]
MVKKNPTGQQPMPEGAHKPGTAKENPFGESAADTAPEGEKTKYDKPSVASDDFAIDEQREKRIRGNEAPKD